MHDNKTDRRRPKRVTRRQMRTPFSTTTTSSSFALAVLAVTIPTAMAWTPICVPLTDSTECPQFRNASINTGQSFPFLEFVSNVSTFDAGIRDYARNGYARRQYQDRIGCSKVNLDNTTDIYARYTTSVLCNFIVQGSISACGLNEEQARPLCAPSCGEYAISEQEITASPELCGTPGNGAIDIIRADYQDCSNPTRALTGTCIEAALNEPDECGYGNNLRGLCSFCGSSSANSTDSCCVNADVERRCVGVKLPTTSSMPPVFPTSTNHPKHTISANPVPVNHGHHLSGGAIAGIVVGSVVGAALLLAALIFCCIHLRRRKQHQGAGILNTPSPTRQGPPMTFNDNAANLVPGGRVARMSALERSSDTDHRAGGFHGAYRGPHDAYSSSPDSGRSHLAGGNLPKRDGSLSSNSMLMVADEHSSPRSGTNTERNFSSPEGMASGQSEQLQFFKDYYSQDEIRPNDTVAVLWAYQPRAADEFELERGDMLKVVGIWDDGWATGVKIAETTEEWEARRQDQRDSGISNGGTAQTHTPESDNEIKAFPMVCVCLPQHWRKTIEGDSTDTGAGSGGDKEPPTP